MWGGYKKVKRSMFFLKYDVGVIFLVNSKFKKNLIFVLIF